MRIGITGYPTYGGSGVVATELGQELAARGHDVHFITYAPPIRINLNHPHIHFHQAAVVSYPCSIIRRIRLSLAVKMLEVFEQEKLDILHVHYAIPHSVSALLARQMAAPRSVCRSSPHFMERTSRSSATIIISCRSRDIPLSRVMA